MEWKSTRANLILLLTAVIWGGGFVAQRMGMEQMGPFMFNGFRFLIGALSLVPVMMLRKKPHKPKPGEWRLTLGIGTAAGLFLFWGATFQQLGLISTTAGKAGFITGLYVIIVPLLGALGGDRAPWNTWIGAALAVVGLYFLSVTRGLIFDSGDGYVLAGAFFWAAHVQFLARFAPRVDAVRLSFIQALVTSGISFVVALAIEEVNWGGIREAVWPIIYGGVVSIGIAYTLQIIGQLTARPTPAAIILSLESVFAAFWGWLLLSETFTPRNLAGSLLMLVGMVFSQLKFQRDT
jgi:drug/metabolite transporter (DMT)-like permease